MTEPWRYFWFTLGVSAVLASVLACIERSTNPINLGSVADWVAGAATASAVVVALFTARRQGALALKVAEEDRAARRLEILDNDIRVMKALLLVLANGYGAIRTLKSFDDETGGEEAKSAIVNFGLHVDKVATRLLDDVRIEQLPSTTAVDLLMAARSTWSLLADQVYAAQDAPYPAMWLNTLDLSHLDKILEALADEIIRRGGRVTGIEDQDVQNRLRRAAGRAGVATK